MQDLTRWYRRLAAVLVAALAAGLVLTGAQGSATVATTAATAEADTDTDTDYGRMLLLLDSSGSMKEPAGGGQTKIEAARAALGEVVDDLPEDADVGLRVFGAEVFSRSQQGACTDSQLVVEPGTGNRDDLRKAVASYQPYGETPIAYALQQAAKDIGGEGKRSIVLVSDGIATCQPDPCDVAGKIAAQGIDLQIDVVGLSVTGEARAQLACIAERGNGTYYDVDSANEIAESLTRVAERAVRPFTVSGRPIEGGTAENPTLMGLGDWRDTLPPNQSPKGPLEYLVEKRWSGSTLRISAVSPGDVGEWDGVQIEMFPIGEEGTCEIDIDYRDLDTTSVLGAEVATDPESGCAPAGTYRVAVDRWLAASAAVPVALRVSEQPPIVDPGITTTETKAKARRPRVSGATAAVIGGSSFADAAKIDTGRFSSTIVPGEAQMYRIPIDYGQGLRVRTHFANSDRSGLEPYVAMRLYNPMFGVVGNAEGSSTFGPLPGAALDLDDALPSISHDLLLSNGDDFSMAGYYYLGLSVVAREGKTDEWPYSLDVEVTGKPAAGPTYADGVSWSVDSAVLASTQPDKGSQESTAPDDEESSESTTTSRPGDAVVNEAPDDGGLSAPVKLASVGGLGLVAIGCLAVALMLLRSKRPPRS